MVGTLIRDAQGFECGRLAALVKAGSVLRRFEQGCVAKPGEPLEVGQLEGCVEGVDVDVSIGSVDGVPSTAATLPFSAVRSFGLGPADVADP